VIKLKQNKQPMGCDSQLASGWTVRRKCQAEYVRGNVRGTILRKRSGINFPWENPGEIQGRRNFPGNIIQVRTVQRRNLWGEFPGDEFSFVCTTRLHLAPVVPEVCRSYFFPR